MTKAEKYQLLLPQIEALAAGKMDKANLEQIVRLL